MNLNSRFTPVNVVQVIVFLIRNSGAERGNFMHKDKGEFIQY